MKNLEISSYTDEDIAEAYTWIRKKIGQDLLAGKDVEKYRKALKEVGDEMNFRINAMLKYTEKLTH